jgi:hypothetical protein
MKTEVTFRSNKFPAYDGEEMSINPGLWGKRLAEYLQEKLEREGFGTQDIYAEDWGWVVPIKNDGFALWIGCGHQNGADDEFLCFVQPSKPVIRKLFRKIDTTKQVGRVVDVLGKILSSDKDVRDICWSEFQ